MTTTPTLNRHERRRLAKMGRRNGVTPEDEAIIIEFANMLDALASEPSNDAAAEKMGQQGLWLTIMVKDGMPLRQALGYLAKSDELQYPGLYKNHHQLVLDRGRQWTRADVTYYADLDAPALPNRSCYENAYLAAGHLGLKYAEGWGLAEVVPDGTSQVVRIVAHHGWAYNPETGGIVEASPEWEAATQYLGIVYEPRQVDETFSKTRFYGMVPNDKENGYDLLARGLLGTDYAIK